MSEMQEPPFDPGDPSSFITMNNMTGIAQYTQPPAREDCLTLSSTRVRNANETETHFASRKGPARSGDFARLLLLSAEGRAGLMTLRKVRPSGT